MSDLTAKAISSQGVSMDINIPDVMFDHQPINAAKVVSAPGTEGKCPDVRVKNSVILNNVNLNKGKMKNIYNTKGELRPIYDINYAGVEDKCVNSILHVNQFKLSENNDKVDTEIYNSWRRQSNFGFVPISEQLLPETDVINKVMENSLHNT